ncbi:hypothetical protein BBP40_010597 [Aspergillus hancockii]|nr:hypothetical protein BBP40_010597 [Aspergillus hancockii]
MGYGCGGSMGDAGLVTPEYRRMYPKTLRGIETGILDHYGQADLASTNLAPGLPRRRARDAGPQQNLSTGSTKSPITEIWYPNDRHVTIWLLAWANAVLHRVLRRGTWSVDIASI